MVERPVAAMRAGEEMAQELGDTEFAKRCRTVFATGMQNLDARCWRESFGYYVQVTDTTATQSIGVYDAGHIDQVIGQSWARQVGLGDVMKTEHVKRALQSLWDYNFTTAIGPFLAVHKAGRWYA
ncbi:MAG: GH116 family glycosyl hydrolase [Verrucomicrobiota bacterium]